MNYLKLPGWIIFFLLSFSCLYGQGQKKTIEVSRSTERIILNGKIFYVHVVKKGETLFSIAKAYNVTTQDIIQYNPSAAEGIKADQVLKIPETGNKGNEVMLKESGEYRYHIVEKGQTLFSIAQKYGTKVDELIRLNPELEVSNIQVNQVIKIPLRKEAVDSILVLPAPELQSVSYVVKEGETLFSISRKYNTSVEAIRKANPSIEQDNIKAGMVIQIPLTGKLPVNDSTRQITPGLSCYVKSFCDSLAGSTRRSQVKAALLLPFYSTTEAEDSVEGMEQNVARLDEQNTEISPVSACFTEFYEGVLLALKALKEEGISVTLHTFDTEKGLPYLLALTLKPEFLQSDLVIGPVLAKELNVIQPVCKEKAIPLISPISQNPEFIKDNPLFFQVNPSNNKCFDMMMNYIAGFEKENIIVMLQPAGNDAQSALQADIIRHYFADTSAVKIVYFVKDSCDPSLFLDASRRNLIIIPSKDETFVTSAIAMINTYFNQYNIEVFGPSAWLSFTSIDIEFLHNLQFTYFTPFFVDYSSPAVKSFLAEFRKVYGFEPGRMSSHGFNYAMLGYDIAYRFIKAYAIYGKAMGCCLQDIKEKSILGDYNFVRTSIINGFQNESGAIVKFTRNFEVKKIMDVH